MRRFLSNYFDLLFIITLNQKGLIQTNGDNQLVILQDISVCLCICLSLYLFVSVSVCLSLYLSVSVSFCSCVCLCPSVCVFVSPSVCLSLCLSVSVCHGPIMPLCVKSSCSSSFISTASVTSLWRKTFTSLCNLHTPRPRHSHSRLGHTLIIIIILNLVHSVQKIPRVQQWVDRKLPHLNCVATLPWETGKNCSTFTKVTVKTRRSTKMMLRASATSHTLIMFSCVLHLWHHDSTVYRFMPWTSFADWHQNWFSCYQTIMLTNLVRDEQTDGQHDARVWPNAEDWRHI